MRLVCAGTPEGFVVRRIWADREDAWRRAPDGAWSHCAGHKGPWIVTNAIYVPADVLRVFCAAMDMAT